MATRTESKSRKTQRYQASATRSTSTGNVTLVKGKFPRLDERAFPATGGVDITRVKLTAIV